MTKNIIVAGGLGNQMFIYAFYFAMRQHGIEARLDVSLYRFVKMHNGYELPDIFNIPNPEIDKGGLHIYWLRFMLKYNSFLIKDQMKFNPKIFSLSTKYISGYWQCELYFENCKQQIVNVFKFRNISENNLQLALEMQKRESVSLHIRRGDYLTTPMYLGICTEEYYCKAINEILSRIKAPHFYIFSNDMEWSAEFAKKLGIDYTLVSHNTGKNSYQDMYLMTQCRHNILANSSFSWWGAYLNQHINAIKIAPARWDNTDSDDYNHVRVPADYIRL